MTNYITITTTCESRNDAEKLANLLLDARLIACAQLDSIESLYHWQGKLQRATETRLTIKTRAQHYPAIEELIAKSHSYEVPEIIAQPIVQGSPDYLDWIERSTSPKPIEEE